MPKQDMSFLPQDYIEKRMRRRTDMLSLTLFVVVMGAVVAAYVVTNQQGSIVQAEQEAVAASFADAAQRLDELDRLKDRKQQMMRKARITAMLVEPVQRSVLLAEMINNMPPTLSLQSFELETKVIRETQRARTSLQRAKNQMAIKKKQEDGELDAPPPTEVSIRLVGHAPTDVEVAQFMTALGRCELFTDVNLTYSQEAEVEDQLMRRFRVEMQLNQSVDMGAYQPTRKTRLRQNPMGTKMQFEPQLVMPPADAAPESHD